MNFSTPPFHSARSSQESPPFDNQEQFLQLKQDDGSVIAPSINCKIEKGFFVSHDKLLDMLSQELLFGPMLIFPCNRLVAEEASMSSDLQSQASLNRYRPWPSA